MHVVSVLLCIFFLELNHNLAELIALQRESISLDSQRAEAILSHMIHGNTIRNRLSRVINSHLLYIHTVCGDNNVNNTRE